MKTLTMRIALAAFLLVTCRSVVVAQNTIHHVIVNDLSTSTNIQVCIGGSCWNFTTAAGNSLDFSQWYFDNISSFNGAGWTAAGGGGCSLPPVSGGSPDITYYLRSCSSTGTNYYCVNMTVLNSDIQPHQYVGCNNGNPITMSGWLSPGQSWTFNHCETQPWTPTILRMQAGTDGTDQTLYPPVTTNTSPAGANSSTNLLAGSQGEQWSGSTSNIVWGTNDTRSGFAALLDALTRQNQILAGVSTNSPFASLYGMSTNMQTTVNVTNINSTVVTNNNNVTVTNNIQLTNNFDERWSSNLYVLATNHSRSGSNIYSFTSAMTNGQAAWDLAGTTFTAKTNFEIAAGFGDVTGAGITGAGSTTGLSFAFCGYTLNLDPESQFPGMMAIIKDAWTFLLLAGFAIWVGKTVLDITRSLGSMASGGVPDLEGEVFGIGGNVLGFTVAIMAAFALILVTGICLGYIFQLFLTQLGLLPSAATAFSLGGNGIALYLLHSSFPVTLFLTLTSLRITLQFTAAKYVGLALAAARFILNR